MEDGYYVFGCDHPFPSPRLMHDYMGNRYVANIVMHTARNCDRVSLEFHGPSYPGKYGKGHSGKDEFMNAVSRIAEPNGSSY